MSSPIYCIPLRFWATFIYTLVKFLLITFVSTRLKAYFYFRIKQAMFSVLAWLSMKSTIVKLFPF